MNDNDDEMLPEYDLASMGPPVRGKHYDDYRKHIRVIRLAEPLSTRFPTEDSVIEALRSYVAEHPSELSHG